MSFSTSIQAWWNKSDTSSATESFNLVFAIVASVIWLIGIIIIAVDYSRCDQPKCINGFGIFGKLLFFSGAAYLTGIISGFLFGMPKSLQQNTNNSQNSDKGNNLFIDKFVTNTNLEQISDWLTKIIVGLGLVNFKKIPSYLEELRLYFAQAFSGLDSTISYCVLAITIFSVITGFIFMYIYTRINISALFFRSSIDEQQLINDLANKLNQPGNADAKESFVKQLK